MITTTPNLRALLRDCRVQASFEDVAGQRRTASTDAQIALLRSLGVNLNSPREAGEILSARQLGRLNRGVEPVVVAWHGRRAPLQLTLPASIDCQTVNYEVDLGSEHLRRRYSLDELRSLNPRIGVASEFITYNLPLPPRLQSGYHRLRIEAGDKRFESLVISTPRKAYVHEDEQQNSASLGANPNGNLSRNGSHQRGRRRAMKQQKREWGAFLPLYALRTERDWGAGDYGGLQELTEWTAKLGGSAVGTLPLFSTFLDEPFEGSPYRPASRLFWSEFFIDVEAIPELEKNERAQNLINSHEFRRQISAQRAREFVDYRAVMRLKREALSLLAAEFFVKRPPRFAEFQKFRAENPAIEDYARFRAAVERRRAAWPGWPARMRAGKLDVADYDASVVEFYLYAQWIASQQIASLHEHVARNNSGLYLDLPVGVDPGSYDVWRHQRLYLTDATIGAPPDPVYPHGQEWGLAPLHPERIREDGYCLFRRVIEASMKFARYLRIDHVMGLERLYCIPQGFSSEDGVYVRYNSQETFAVVVLESHRNRCAVLGENLGTVPREVDRRMKRHGIGGMWVAPYELEPGRREILNPPELGSVASLNTHDMPPFAAWRQGAEVADREALGLIDAKAALREREERREQVKRLEAWLLSIGALSAGDFDEALLGTLLNSITASSASLVLVNLEDLWQETRPQNFPGTTNERPNWSRKAKLSLEAICQSPEVRDLLAELTTIRKGKPKPR